MSSQEMRKKIDAINPFGKSTSHVVLARAKSSVAVVDVGWVLVQGRLSSDRRLLNPDSPRVNQTLITEDLIDGLTDAVSIYRIEYEQSVREEVFGVIPPRCFAAAVEQRLKTAGQTNGYAAVAVPKARLNDEKCQTETMQFGTGFRNSYDVLPGVRLADGRIVTVNDGKLTECAHHETEPIAGTDRRQCADCGRSFDPQLL